MSLTTDPTDPRLTHGPDEAPAPQAEVYLVLSPEERAKGFIRPVRTSYVHTGKRPRYALRDLTTEEIERCDGEDYVKYEKYPDGLPAIGRFWTLKELNSGCGSLTRMGLDLAETYARAPNFYGATYCCDCRKHLPVAEFRWADAEGKATALTVGS